MSMATLISVASIAVTILLVFAAPGLAAPDESWPSLTSLETSTMSVDGSPAPALQQNKNYFFAWYDNIGGANWILMSNPVRSGKHLNFTLNIAGRARDLSPFALKGGDCSQNQCPPGDVPPGMTMTPRYHGLMGGPVISDSLAGDEGIISQRTLWQGSSLEEVPGTDENQLSGHYYWTWYDSQSPGMKNWILISNPSNTSSVTYSIKIAGGQVSAGTLAAGQYITPIFMGTMGGPVEVTASGKIIASQRVLSNSGSAFNEVPGIPEGGLSSHYVWSWYDQKSAGAKNWVLVANPNNDPVYAEIKVSHRLVWAGTVNSGGRVTPVFPGTMGGPVDVQAWTDQNKAAGANVISSQRSLWGPSFEEVPGYPESKLTSDYHWTWYDQQSAGVRNWVLVANPNNTAVGLQIKIGGVTYWSGSIAAGDYAIPTFPWVMSGPVEVASTGGPVITSQRVLWNGYFNEMMGTVLNTQDFVTPEWELQRLLSNPHPGNYVDEFLIRDINGPNTFVSSNAALWPDTASGYDYRLINGAIRPFMNPLRAVAQFGSAVVPGDGQSGKIYLAGQAWFGDTPPKSTRRRSLFTIWDLSTDTFQNIEMAAAGKRTDNRNELVTILDDGLNLIAGEAAGITDPSGDSNFPRGGGLWLIPKSTIMNPATWSRFYEEPQANMGESWYDLLKRGDTYFALQNAGPSHRVLASNNLTDWNVQWSENTQQNHQARSNLLLDATGNLVVVHERAASNNLWVAVFDGVSWSQHQTGIPNVPPGGPEASLDIAAAYDDAGKLLVFRGRGAAWNRIPAFTDIYRIDPADWSYRILYTGIPGWPMHQKRLPVAGGGSSIYYSTSYPGYLYGLRHNP